MKDFVIMTDSSCDLPSVIVEKYGIKVVPLAITLNDKTYKHYYDYRELIKNEYFDALENGLAGTTAGANISDAFKMMSEIAEEGKDILYLSLSSGLSGSYNNAVIACDMMENDYPDTVVRVIDSKSVCVGLGLLSILAARAKSEGKNFNEVSALIDEKIGNIKHYFTVNDLAALSRSGWISHLTAMAGSMLNIKPMLSIDFNGKIQSIGKVRGRKASIKQLIDNAVKNVEDSSIFFIAHANAIEDAESIKVALLEKYPNSEILISDVGPIIGVHTGIGTLAIICA